VRRGRQQAAPQGKLQERNAFLHRAPRDAEKVSAVGFGEATVSFGDVGGDREGGPVELISQKAVSAREAFGSGTDFVGEVDGPLVDESFSKAKDMRGPREKKRVESRK